MTRNTLLELRDIVKTFPGGVTANDGADLTVERGEIHGLLGENGAGKSTLMRTLYGLYSPDSGEIRLRGEPVRITSPERAIDLGVGMVHQHFMIIPRLSVVENVIIGQREPAGLFQRDEAGLGQLLQSRFVQSIGSRFSIGREPARQRIRALNEEYGLDVDVDATVGNLDVGQQQRVEILKALYRDVDLLILDEPTAALTPRESEQLFATLRSLVDDGLSVIFITHKLDEITSITDRVTVLKDGQTVGTVETAETTRSELAEMMVGREVVFEVDKDRREQVGDPILTARGITADDDRGQQALHEVDIRVHAGEIVGIIGVGGNGQRELVECLVGERTTTDGEISVKGEPMTKRGPRAFLEAGLSYIPEDRLQNGCAPGLSVAQNAILRDYHSSRFDSDGLFPFLDSEAVREYAKQLVEEFDIRVGSLDTRAGELSGGNLQKLILARELSRDPDAIVAHHPTRGLDVGAIEYVQELILEQQQEDTAILLVTESLDEVLDMSDRILVMYEGEIVYETTPQRTDRQDLGLHMTGGSASDSEQTAAVAEGEGKR